MFPEDGVYLMKGLFRGGLVVLVSSLLFVTAVRGDQAQGTLGPETKRSIREAKLDPAFQSTVPLAQIALLPFANTGQFQECSTVISKNLLEQIGQKHPEYKLIRPDDLMNFAVSNRILDDFNVFLGDYLESGTARQDFLSTLGTKLKVDAVLLGKLIGCGSNRGKSYVIEMEMALYRVKDGRRIWWGKDSTVDQRLLTLPESAQDIADVFARFLGRSGY